MAEKLLEVSPASERGAILKRSYSIFKGQKIVMRYDQHVLSYY